MAPLHSASVIRPALQNSQIACSNCALASICLPAGIPESEVAKLDSLIRNHPRLAPGEFLFQAESPFFAVYAIRRGFFKTTIIAKDGREQITGFHMPGDLLGMDAIFNDHYTCFASALEDAEVCEVPFTRLEYLASQVPSLQKNVHRIMSGLLINDQSKLMMLGNMRANERIAAFLVDLSGRFRKRGYSRYSFNLAMTRGEIGNFTGLKLETVSRTFSKLQKEGYIGINRKLVEILDLDGLKKLASND